MSVKVVIEYPKDWKGERFFQEGVEQEVSKECALHFTELGIIKGAKKAKDENKDDSK